MEDEEQEEGEEEEQQPQPRRPKPEQEPQLYGKVLYDMSGGTPHGRFPVGNNGAVSAANVRAAAKENRAQPLNSVSMQRMAQEMARLHRANERLQQDNHAKNSALQQSKVATDLILVHIGYSIFHISTIDVFFLF